MKRFYLCIALFIPLLLNAQSQLTLQSAIDTALKNSFDIQIANTYVRMAKASNNYGMAGGLPYINASAGDNLSLDNIDQNFSDGTSTNISSLGSNSLNAGISANIVLFNGFKVLATKKRLSYIQKQSEIEFNGQIQNTIAAVMIKYYDIIRQQSYLKIIQSMNDVSQKKLDIINEKKNVGMANGVDIMQSQSDVNTSLQNMTIQQLRVDEAKADLLLIINAKANMTYTINDSITIDNTLVLDSIVNYIKRNPKFLSAEQQVRINEQIVKETAAQRYPSLKLNTAYNFGRTDNNAGYTLLNQSYGPTAGLTLQVPIFNGNVYRTQKIVAGLNVSISKLEKESLYSKLITTAMKKYLSYTTTLKQIESQRNNFELSKKLVDLVLQNFQYGQATILDVKAAQNSYEIAAYQLINFQYAAKISEIELKQLIYQLRY
jgi:outer membrane protein TolC